MSLGQWLPVVGMTVGGLALVIRGRTLVRWPRHRPPDPPGVIRAVGLCVVLVAASITAGAGLHAPLVALALAVAAPFVVLVPVILASRQGRI